MYKLQRNHRGSEVLLAAIALLMFTTACERKPEGTATQDNKNADRASAPSSQMTAAQIIERYRALDNSRDSTIKMRVVIRSQDESASPNPQQIQLTMHHKRASDGRIQMLAEFTSPPEERDRDGLVTVFPDGRIEAVRYVQSTDSFLVANDATSEDALLGLTPQELADGQPEKYDFTVAGEETHEGTPVYRLEGKLKQRAESKFPRLVMLISKQDFAPLEAEFYDNHNELARRLVINKADQISGHWTRQRWNIDNLARRKKIEFEAIDVKYDQNLSDSMFTREHLKKIASR